jgi:biopolymer transport protein ExbB/TolQ
MESTMILIFEWLARLILVGLIGLSIWSVQIMLERRKFFKSNTVPMDELLNLLKSGKGDQFVKEVQKSNPDFASSLSEISNISQKEDRDQIFQIFLNRFRDQAQTGLPVLGTLGSTTPFIGLLGTVMGIIVSFGKLSDGGGGTNAVMFSLAEALVLTAVGLIVAIPAVIAFNYFGRKVKGLTEQLVTLKDTYFVYRKEA